MSNEWTKAAWITEFINILVVELRPDIGRKFACTVALDEWVCDPETDPATAAKAWAMWAERGLGEPSPPVRKSGTMIGTSSHGG